MRTSMLLSLCALVVSGRAAASELSPRGLLGLDSQATRYGTSYETVYLLSLEPRAALQLGSLELSALLPLSTSATYPTFCCRLALGNATVSALLREHAGSVRHWYEVGVSLPSSYWSDPHASSLAATAALLHDAGRYLPETTTLRAGLGAELEVSPWLALGVEGAAHYWLRADDALDPLLVPLRATATFQWAPDWSAQARYLGLTRVLAAPGTEERFLSELSVAVAHTWSGSRLEASLSVPLDDSLRELGMFSVGTRYARSF